jgi:sodium transport system permease protein
MRWSIIRTIWFREMRDQMRDRRTLLVILGLPLILYPLLGFAFLTFASGFVEKPSTIGIVTTASDPKGFPPRQPPSAGLTVAPHVAWLSATPMGGSDLAQCLGAFTFSRASSRTLDYQPLVAGGEFTVSDPRIKGLMTLQLLDRADLSLLGEHKVDLILEAPADFFRDLEKSDGDLTLKAPRVRVHELEGDRRSRLAATRMGLLLERWKHDLKKARLARRGLTESYLEPFDIQVRDDANRGANRDDVVDLVIRIFPFMLVMWSLAGALYPAIDLCAGEKERGTMETLLITPAGREEIVLGKFLTIWVFSSATAILNLFSMGVGTAMFSEYLPQGGISIVALLWCAVLSLPQSAFFSAISLAIGAYARSSKEGQYYLMPLFILTMPLIFLTLAPGVQLNPLYSMVPVTGVALLMQRLMTGASLSDIPYFIPVLAPVALYSWLALRWAIEQFNREDVLFREAERLDVGLWFRSLFRDKEPLPTTGQAFFCLALLIGLRWLSLGLGAQWPLEIHTVISQLALVATPPLIMVLFLNTRPADGIYLRWPSGRETGLAAILALLLLAPMTGLTQAIASWVPHLLEGAHPLVAILRAIHTGEGSASLPLVSYFLAFALVPALCEEIAFRGFILRGLHHGFRPRNAVLLSSFFFALFHMNVFLFLPTFVLGVILGLLTVRSKSLLPAISFHLLHNSVLIALIPLSRYSDGALPRLLLDAWPWLIGLCLLLAAGLVWWLYRKPYVELARREAEESRQEAGS